MSHPKAPTLQRRERKMHFPGLELRPLRCNSGTFKSTNTSKGFSGFGIAATTLQQWRTQKYQHFKDYPCLGLRLLLCNSGTLKSTKHAWSRSLCCPFVCVMHMQLCHTHAFIMSYTCIYVMQMHLCHTHAFMSCTCIYVIHMNLCHAHASIMSCTCVYDTFLFAFLLCPLWRNASSHLRATAPSLRQVMC